MRWLLSLACFKLLIMISSYDSASRHLLDDTLLGCETVGDVI